MGSIREAALRLSLIDNVTQKATGIRGALEGLDNRISRFDRSIRQTRGQLFNAAGVAVAAGAALAVPIRRAVEFESAMADIRKVVDFESPEAFQRMASDILDLSKRLPMTAEGIAAIVAAAGQSGLANDELLAFAEMAAKVGVAWEVSADEAGDALAKLKTALGLTVADTQLLADAINHLGNNSAANAPAILAFTRRVAPMAGQFGFTAEQAAALGAGMIGAGFEAEVAATSFLNMGRSLTAGASATKRQRAAYQALGLDAKQVAIDMQRDAVGTLDDVLSRLRAAPDHLRASMMTDIFGAEARALGPLVSNAELFAEVLDLVRDRLEYAGSAQAEYEERAKTTANTLQLLRNRVTAAGIAFGNLLLPAVNDIAGALGPVVDRITAFVQANPRLIKAAVGATVALLGLRVALLGGKLAFLVLGRQALVTARGVLATSLAIGKAGAAVGRFSVAPVVGGFAAAKRALVGFAGAASVLGTRGAAGVSVSSMGKTVLGLLNPLRLLRGAAVLARGALMFSGVGIAIAGVAAAASWIWNNLEGLAEFARGVGQGLMSAFEPVAPIFEPIASGLGKIAGWVTDLLGPVDASASEWRGWGVAVGEAIGGAVVAVVELPGRIAAAAAGIYAAGLGLADSAWRGVKDGWNAGLGWLQAQGDAFGQKLQGWRDQAATALQGIPAAIREIGGEMLAVGGDVAQAMADGVRAKIRELVDWFRGLPGRILAAVGSIDLAGLVRWPSMPSWLGGGGPSIREQAAANNAGGGGFPTIDGRREHGGPVSAGKLYLVGERGPELYRPAHDGEVIPNGASPAEVPAPAQTVPAAALAAAYQSAPVTVSITVNGSADTSTIRQLEAAAERAVRRAMSGLDNKLNRGNRMPFTDLQFGDM